MFREIFTLAKILFKRIRKDDMVTVEIMQHFPFKGYSAMMWCGTIIIREDCKEDISRTVLNHEEIHLAQAKVKGNWLKYYISYLWNWFKHNPLTHSSYYLNKYEGEAFANEDKEEYVKTYTGENIYKYDLGREYWRKYPSPEKYKNFIKTL